MPAAIVAVAGLSAIAALATVAARVALLEASAVRDEATSELVRLTLRSRVTRVLATTSGSELMAAPAEVGGQDTVLVVTPLAWPWHRVAVVSGGAELIAELARAAAPLPTWCAPVVAGDLSGIPAGAVTGDPLRACDEVSQELPADLIAAFADTVLANLVLAPAADTLRISESSPVPRIWLARGAVEILAGIELHGLVVARDVYVGAGARVNGLIAAMGSVVAEPGARMQGDRLAASSAVAAAARLVLLGRRGLLLSP